MEYFYVFVNLKSCKKTLDGINKEVAGLISEHASSEGHGDAAAYQATWHRLRSGQDRPRHHQ